MSMILVPSTKLAAAHQFAAVSLAGGTPSLVLAVLVTGLALRVMIAFAPVLAIHARYRSAQTAVLLMTFGLVRPQINHRAMRREVHTALMGARRAAMLR